MCKIIFFFFIIIPNLTIFVTMPVFKMSICKLTMKGVWGILSLIFHNSIFHFHCSKLFYVRALLWCGIWFTERTYVFSPCLYFFSSRCVTVEIFHPCLLHCVSTVLAVDSLWCCVHLALWVSLTLLHHLLSLITSQKDVCLICISKDSLV